MSSSTSSSVKSGRKINANPPYHAVLTIVIILAICLVSIPHSLDTIDTIATLEMCTMPLFPDSLSRAALGWIRISFALVIFIVAILRFNEPCNLSVSYIKGSKLRRTPVNFGGIRSLAAFTTWCWILLGFSFTCSGLVTLLIERQPDLPITSPHYLQYALRAVILLFEMSAPLAMFVSIIVTYVLWPIALKGPNGTEMLRRPTVIMQHNFNVIMSLMEIAVLGGLPIRIADIFLAPLFGVAYVLFSWCAKHWWLPSGEPQFMYLFLDTTVGIKTTIFLVGLLMVLVLSYGCFMLLNIFVVMVDGNVWVNGIILVLIAYFACRFRD